MAIYFLIAAIYGMFALARGVPLHIAAGLGIIWPIFLCLGLLGRFSMSKMTRSNGGLKSIDECREQILEHMRVVLAGLSKKQADNRDPEFDDLWLLLSVDFMRYITAIKSRPGDIPVMASVLVNSIALLEDTSKLNGMENNDQKTLGGMANYLAQKTNDTSSALIRMHGHKVTNNELKVANEFIDSLKWDANLNKFRIPET